MEFSKMETAELLERRAAIASEVDKPEADLEALEKEVRAINAELEKRKADAERRAGIRAAVAAGAGDPVASHDFDQKKKRTEESFREYRNSREYTNAYAEYIKTGNDAEIRQLITNNAPEGTTGNRIFVPTYLEDRIATAWENDPILSRVRRTYLPGNATVEFEASATGAAVHAEGAAAPAEEQLVLGTVTLIPEFVKKWIKLTDSVIRLRGRAFLDYIYDELTYRITLEAARVGVQDIANAPATSNATQVGVPVVTGAPSVTIIPTAAAYLAGEAGTPVVLMNRLTEVDFIAAQAAGSFAVDPFAGLEKLYTSALPAYSAATTGQTYAIVGNLFGERFNFPDGDDVEIIYDPYTEAEANKVKIVGRYFVGHGVTAPGYFAKINKA